MLKIIICIICMIINEIEAIIEDAGVTVEVDEYIEKCEEEV